MSRIRADKKSKRLALKESELESIKIVGDSTSDGDAATVPISILAGETKSNAQQSASNCADVQTSATDSETAPIARTSAPATGEFFTKYFTVTFNSFEKYLWSLRAPILLLASVAIMPRVILLWIVIVLLKPLVSKAFARLPQQKQNQIIQNMPNFVRNSELLRDLGEGADQCLPFILFWLYLCCAPFAVLWIAGHWVRGFLPQKPPQIENGLVFEQNRKRDLAQPENNFYYSKAFGITVIAFFALGIPAFTSYSIYKNLGVENEVKTSPAIKLVIENPTIQRPIKKRKFIGGYPRHPVFSKAKGELLGVPTPMVDDPTYVAGYNSYLPSLGGFSIPSTPKNVFLAHFYLFGLASAFTVLFFRAWFFFPLNFLSDEHNLYLTARGIRRSTMSNWFLNVLTINGWAIGGGPDSLDWSEIKSLRHFEEGFTKLSPLPETAFKKESLTYKLLNKLASFIDGMTARLNTGNYLVLSTTEKEGDFGQNIRIDLNDLNREQRAKLFYSIKNWAPHMVIGKDAQELLLGSVVLQDVRYTQLWFDLLTANTKVKRQSLLIPGEVLHKGAYTVEQRLSSGGQATAYLARNSSSKQVVLKEFILAISSTSGALLESAREFETEVSLLSQLNHPGIVKLEDFFTEDGRVYVVLEYVPGQTLRQKIQQDGPLSEAAVINITSSISDALEYLHKLEPPIVHRDVTPENVLLLPDGTIKLIDFSLAVKTDGASTTDSCGKQAFTPPEQFRDEVCPASDIYGLGATMYFMLTGVPPKPITVSSPKQKSTAVSDKLNNIVERATQLDLSQRYDSIHWLKLDLAGCTADTEFNANTESNAGAESTDNETTDTDSSDKTTSSDSSSQTGSIT
jgi:hypothetical protein